MQNEDSIDRMPEVLTPAVDSRAVESQELGETAEVEGRVSEIVGDVSEKQGDSSVKQSQTTQAQEENARENARAELRKQLLAKAPDEREMKSQVLYALKKQQSRLEKSMDAAIRKGDYDTESFVLAELRSVFKQITEIAQMSLEALQEAWLKLVKNF